MVFDTVQRAPPLAEQIYNRIRQQLRAGTFGSGERLIDAALAKALNVSRTPVREALSRLVADGLLETGDGGFQVPVPTPSDMEEIFAIRRLIEPPAAAESCRTMESKGHTAIARAFEAAHRASEEGDLTRFIEANYAFRSAWVGCVPNRRLRETILRFDDQAGLVRQATLVLPEARTEAIRLLEHWAEAFRRRDEEAVCASALAFIDAAARFFHDIAPDSATAWRP
jgi:DNA-binding GntR family transcriptional regulator